MTHPEISFVELANQLFSPNGYVIRLKSKVDAAIPCDVYVARIPRETVGAYTALCQAMTGLTPTSHVVGQADENMVVLVSPPRLRGPDALNTLTHSDRAQEVTRHVTTQFEQELQKIVEDTREGEAFKLPLFQGERVFATQTPISRQAFEALSPGQKAQYMSAYPNPTFTD